MTTNEERQYIIKKLMQLPAKQFLGTIDDLTQLQEAWMLRIGMDDEWLEKMYGAHVQVIGECFTCFSKEKPIRLIKLDDKTCLLYTSPSPRDRQKSRMP